MKRYNNVILSLILFIFNLNSVYSFNLCLNRRAFLTKSLALSNYRNTNILLNESDKNIMKKNEISGMNNIYFTGSLNEETCFKLTDALIYHKNLALTEQYYPNHINLYIQSPGGSLLPTLALVDEIKNFEVPIHTYVRGYAASAATLLSVVGKERYIYKNSLMMIHGVKLNDQTVSNVLDVKDLNYNVDLFMSLIKNIYLENSNMDKKTLEAMFDHDIWIDSKNALEFGLVDKIL